MNEDPAEGVPEAEAAVEDFAGFEGEAGCFGWGGTALFAIDEDAAGVDGARVVLHEGAESVEGGSAGIAGVEPADGEKCASEKPVSVKACGGNALLEEVERKGRGAGRALGIFLKKGAVEDFGAAVFSGEPAYIRGRLAREKVLARAEKLDVDSAG